MSQNAKDEILGRLRAAPASGPPDPVQAPPLNELSLSPDELVELFVQNLLLQTTVVHRATDREEMLTQLGEVLAEEGVKTALASTDDVVRGLGLKEWGRARGVDILSHEDGRGREAYKEDAFSVDAGITGVDFAVAESGTLILCHDGNQPRLASLAPILHLAVVPESRLRAVYEQVMAEV